MQRENYKRYVLIVLLLILASNYMDRLALGIVMEDIKRDLSLSDTQLGFLTGIAFAVFYAIMGIPLARWADRGNRVTIISLCVALWSGTVALCAMATGFWQLLVIRIGTAVGEAGCQPPSFSLLSEHFTRAERPRAISRYKLGWPLALLLGYFSAGWLNELYGWRATFVIMGLPGLGLALLAALTLKDPRARIAKSSSDVLRAPQTLPQPGMWSVFRLLWANRTYRHLLICMALAYFFTDGVTQWQAPFFIRSHGLQTGELGTWLAIVYGVAGLVGTWIGGELAFRRAVNNERLQLRAIAVVYVLLAVLSPIAYLVSSRYLAFGTLAIFAFIGAAANGPLFAAIQTVVPSHTRATAIALVLFFCNLIGMGLGPLVVGALSDGLRSAVGDDSLRYALVAMGPGYLWCAWHQWQAGESAIQAATEAQGDDAALDETIAPVASRGVA